MGPGFSIVKNEIAQEVIYSGRVQGVGFRQSVCALASKQLVQGYVQNLDNGKVRLVAHGKSTQVNNLLESVDSIWAENISKIQVNDFRPGDGVTGFSIRY